MNQRKKTSQHDGCIYRFDPQKNRLKVLNKYLKYLMVPLLLDTLKNVRKASAAIPYVAPGILVRPLRRSLCLQMGICGTNYFNASNKSSIILHSNFLYTCITRIIYEVILPADRGSA